MLHDEEKKTNRNVCIFGAHSQECVTSSLNEIHDEETTTAIGKECTFLVKSQIYHLLKVFNSPKSDSIDVNICILWNRKCKQMTKHEKRIKKSEEKGKKMTRNLCQITCMYHNKNRHENLTLQ